MIKEISIIGSGNVASQLAIAFNSVNIKINQILSRNENTGKALAKMANATYIKNITKIQPTSLIVICVNDDNIESVVNTLPNQMMAHTSGSVSIDVFKNKQEYGVIYPVQSLTKNTKINFQDVPICVEANSKSMEKKLIKLTQKISNNVKLLDSKNRQQLHLAAVVACNFSNYCYLIAKNILEQKNIHFDLLKPLIQHTTQKALTSNPHINQTGPARRGDLNIIKTHLSLLKDEKYKEIYKLLSKNIIKEYEK